MDTNILVIGTGTIGEPLIGLLCSLRESLGFDSVMFYKHTPRPDDRATVLSLMKRGALVAADPNKIGIFRKQGIDVTYELEEAIDRAAVVIDCTPESFGLKNKELYYQHHESTTRGFIAQGSEFGFGKMFACGINDEALVPGEDKYIHVVSCNTHNLAALIDTLALSDGGAANLICGRFVCLRRANDISQDTGFIASPTVNKHSDPDFGTHHARDAYHLFKTLGYELNLFSSSIKLNTQYMHSIWFDLMLANPVTLDGLYRRIEANERLAVTQKTSANLVFSFGRDQGYFGRILNPAVIVLPTLQVRNEREVVGFSFTPQDGNSLLSSVAACIWLLSPSEYQQKLKYLSALLFPEV